MRVKKGIKDAICSKNITKHDLLELIKDHKLQNTYNDDSLAYMPQEYEETFVNIYI